MRRLPLFLTVALGALLLFAVQPLTGKWLLPWFGGAPAVWATCLLFFQLAVLVGYAWAAWLLTCRPRRQVAGHLAVIGAALLTLPLRPDPSWAGTALPPPLAVLAILAWELGLPAIALATTAPLIQGWSARLSPGRDPYRLAAVSSAGSLIALLAYPLLIEPTWSRGEQATAFGVGLVAYLVLVGWSAGPLHRLPQIAATAATPAAASPPPTQRWLWLALPAAGTLLLASITEVLCQDVAPVPFLWVAPLALYLVSWILAYAPRCYPRSVALGLALAMNLAVTALQAWPDAPLPLAVGIHLLALFSACWCCHGELARRRPAPEHLGVFHFTTAIGGALGTALAVFAAPLLFANHVEHRLGLIVAAVLALHAAALPSLRRVPGWALAVAGVVAVAGAAVLPRFAHLPGETIVAARRSFFGVLTVRDVDEQDPRAWRREMRHGVTIHGRQMLDPQRRRAPTAYYGHSSGAGLALDRRAGPRRVGVVGLGAGTLATYARPGDAWRFYELDPLVEDMARRWFTFLADAPGNVSVAVGDGRRLLTADTDARYDVLVLDAFSSDAIPVHLLTAEAFALYRDRLAPDGVVAVHISNRHLDLRPVVRAAAMRLQWPCLAIDDEPDQEDRPACEPSIWVITGPDPTLSTDRTLLMRSQPNEFPPVVVPWTDERADLLRVWR